MTAKEYLENEFGKGQWDFESDLNSPIRPSFMVEQMEQYAEYKINLSLANVTKRKPKEWPMKGTAFPKGCSFNKLKD